MNPLKTNDRLLYLKTQFLPLCKHVLQKKYQVKLSARYFNLVAKTKGFFSYLLEK